VKHDLFGKPVRTFPHRALARSRTRQFMRDQILRDQKNATANPL
jgi:hypothetical protein